MKRYLSPWKRGALYGDWERDVLGSDSWLAVFHGLQGWYGVPDRERPFQTEDEAKEALDQWAVENGYQFLTEEQWEKLSVLA